MSQKSGRTEGSVCQHCSIREDNFSGVCSGTLGRNPCRVKCVTKYDISIFTCFYMQRGCAAALQRKKPDTRWKNRGDDGTGKAYACLRSSYLLAERNIQLRRQ